MNTQVLTVSSKGQISLPIAIRKRLSIDPGDKLVAYTSGDVIMLKTLKLPTAEEFEASLDEAQKWASSVGYKEEDVNDSRSRIYSSAGKEAVNHVLGNFSRSTSIGVMGENKALFRRQGGQVASQRGCSARCCRG